MRLDFNAKTRRHLFPMTPMLHTPDFINQWRKMLVALYGYKHDGDALMVPEVTGTSTSVYLPLLSYSDLSAADAQEKIATLSRKKYQIRSIDASCQSFLPNDTVTMRLALRGKSAEELFKKTIHPKCRNHIRKSEKTGLSLGDGVDEKTIKNFYEIFSTTMHRHGTPVFSRKLFEFLPHFVNSQYLVAYHEGRAVAALCLVFDGKLAWVPWAGSLFEHRDLRPNHFLYWVAIQRSLAAGMEVFDFGRSGYLAPTYDFKSDWGAMPVKLVTLTSDKTDVYQKYTFAAAVWKKLPKRVSDSIGPILCKYLPDL